MANNNFAGTIFITGISVSGKSTLGRRLKEDLLNYGLDNVKLLDGEAVREQLEKRGKYYEYSTEDRNKVAMEIAHIALEYNMEGINCIACSICHKKKTREQMRAVIGNFMEVYLDCPVSVCAKRDYKGQYVKALQGAYKNFVGITEAYQISDHVELILNTSENTVEECLRVLSAKAKNFLLSKSKRVDYEQTHN
ncbi:MAG: adenylyl-sulfate kinase [Candidatus Omnitrophica bacterium]|nr:adenylyl-sulfate kinase [Candidatus Omnitrophota bacterium]